MNDVEFFADRILVAAVGIASMCFGAIFVTQIGLPLIYGIAIGLSVLYIIQSIGIYGK